MNFVDCNLEEHGQAILDILNEAIVTSTALYDYVPRDYEKMIEWFKVKRANNFPVIGQVNERGTLLGFATYGAFRTFPAYKYTFEHSIYVHKDHRGRGYAEVLMKRLVEIATQRDVHVLVGVIDVDNHASIALHEKLGFTHSGTLSQVGFKFGRWLDVAFYQLTLRTPENPKDG